MKKAHRSLLLFCLALTILSSLNASASTINVEQGPDFSKGTMVETELVDDSLQLNFSHPLDLSWSELGSGNPVNRYYHAMAFDKRNGVAVLFGGLVVGGKSLSQSSYLDDTWTYNSTSKTWSQKNPPISPSPRFAHAMVYDDVNGLVILFGGWEYNQNPFGGTALNDTWTYNLTTDSWTEKKTATAPSGRTMHAMTYDSATHKVVLHGGYNGETFTEFHDTWVYDASSNVWTEKKPVVEPMVAPGMSMCYDTASRLTLCIGRNESSPDLLETWTYNLSSNIWTKLTTSVSPLSRTGQQTVFDEHEGVVVLFGGVGPGGPLNDTWKLDVTSSQWTNASPAMSPEGGDGLAMVYDPRRSTSLISGGRIALDPLNLWEYSISTNSWSPAPLLSWPFPKGTTQLVRGAGKGLFVLFDLSMNMTTKSVWVFNSTSVEWTKMPPVVAPPFREGFAAGYHPQSDLFVIFGGCYVDPSNSTTCYVNDTWIYDLRNNRWSEMSPPLSPPARAYHQIVYNEALGEFFLFGGEGGYRKTLHDAWTYNLTANTWIEKTTAPMPSARAGYSIACNPSTSEVVLYGGYYYGMGGFKTDYSDTWRYMPGNNTWSMMNPHQTPITTSIAPMTYHPLFDRFILFGGFSAEGTSMMWLYDLDNDSWNGFPTYKAPVNRQSGMLVYDSVTDSVLLFGGLGRLYQYDYRSDLWSLDIQVNHSTSGYYLSQPIDLGGRAFFGTIAPKGSMPPLTYLLTQIRTSRTLGELNSTAFVGPDGTPDTDYNITPPCNTINKIHNDTRWIQYKVRMGTTDENLTPLLKEMTITYNLLHSIAIINPTDNDLWNGTHDIAWTASDPDNNNLSFDVYIENGSHSEPLAVGLPNQMRNWTWDTSAIPNGTYRVRIVARDDDSAIPLTAEALSGNVTILHPSPYVPNNPPRVDLLNPQDGATVNSSDVRLEWSGTDADGDPLNYTVYHFLSASRPDTFFKNATTSSHFDLSGLPDGVTCWWTVEVSDSKDMYTPNPWHFTIDLSTSNRWPIVTNHSSVTQIRAGDYFQYNISAVDPDGDPLTFSLIEGISTMSINTIFSQGNTWIGQINWTPSGNDVGIHTVSVRISDRRNGVVYYNFTLEVLPQTIPPPERPRCLITYPVNHSLVHGDFTIRGTAVNGSAPLTLVQIRIDGGEWRRATGLHDWSFKMDAGSLKSGSHVVEARAFDGSLFSDISSVTFEVGTMSPISMPEYPLYVGIIFLLFVLVVLVIMWVKRGRK